jgi:hypothetical protein
VLEFGFQPDCVACTHVRVFDVCTSMFNSDLWDLRIAPELLNCNICESQGVTVVPSSDVC